MCVCQSEIMIMQNLLIHRWHWYTMFLHLQLSPAYMLHNSFPESKIHGANMGPTWVLSAPDGPHVGPMNFAIWVMINAIKNLYAMWNTAFYNFIFCIDAQVSIISYWM